MITKLLIASGKRAGRAISMKRDKLLIGRAEECDLRPLSEEVSRKHCAIIKKDDVLSIYSLQLSYEYIYKWWT